MLAPIANQAVNEGSAAGFTASATDADDGQTITYSLIGAPAGASIDPATGVFSWTPTDDNPTATPSDDYTFTCGHGQRRSGRVRRAVRHHHGEQRGAHRHLGHRSGGSDRDLRRQRGGEHRGHVHRPGLRRHAHHEHQLRQLHQCQRGYLHVHGGRRLHRHGHRHGRRRRSDTATYQYVVVYDPGAGFVTGGGWITSPAGAYAADPTLTGRANFGFVSKYQPGAGVPTGQTQFHFKAGDLDFHSTSYEWLVVAGARAQYKGTGTINGSGSYSFLLTVIDGQKPGGGGVDQFRLKIWGAGGVIYDNQMGDGDDAPASTRSAAAAS